MIDDDEVIAGSTSEYFNMFNVKTAYVTSFEAAEKFLEENTVSLLLLDINLGDRSGFDLCANAGNMGSITKITWKRKENSNPLQYSCLGNAMDRGPWWTTVHRVTKSWIQLSD